MKYVIGFTLGVLTALAFRHFPPIFNDTPPTPEDWLGPKLRGSWTDEERAMIANRYYNGGK